MPQNPWDKYEEVAVNPWDQYEEINDGPEIQEPQLNIPPIQVTPQQMEPVAPDTSPSVFDTPMGLWEKFRSPITDIGSRTAHRITSQPVPDISSFDPSGAADIEASKAMIEGAGGLFDSLTAPINALPMLLTGGASALGSKALGLLGRIASAPTAVSGAQNMIQGEGGLQKGLGALEMLGGIAGMKGPKAPEVSAAPPKIEGNIKFATKAEADAAQPIYGGAAPSIEAEEAALGVTPKTKPPSAEAMAATGNVNAKLPVDLAGAKPRFNIGTNSVTPQFESDVDKALYILAQKTPSKRNDDYLKFVMDATGMNADEVAIAAQKVKGAVKENVVASGGKGEVVVPTIHTPKVNTPAAMTAEMMPDYSPRSEATARQVFAAKGVQLAPDMTNKQIIDGARALIKAENPAQKVAAAAPELMKPKVSQPKVKVKSIGNGEFIPDDFPDVVLDADGRVKRTLSGNPVRLPKEVERNLALEVLNLPRAINASMDLSFPFRQGLGLIFTKGWWKAWPDMVKSFGSDKAYQSVLDEIRSRPNYRPRTTVTNGKFAADELGMKIKPSFAEEAGLSLTDNLTVREHEYMSQLAEKMPLGMGRGIKASNRAYTAFANKLRADTFDSLVEDFAKAGMDPRQNMDLAKQIASYVNAASGRGNLGMLEKHAEALNAAFFSPRLVASRAQMMGKSARAVFDPQVYAMSAPNVRREYLKSMLSIGTAWSTVAGLAAAAGANVSLDPTNADFAKIRIGNTRLDPGGGFQQFIVLANRIAQQKSTSSMDKNGKYPPAKNFADAKTPFDPTMGSTLGDFTLNKLNPVPKYVWDFVNATQHEPFDVPGRTAQLAVPIMVQDIMQILNEGNPAELATIPLQTVGIGAQTYGKDDLNRRMWPLSPLGKATSSRKRFITDF